MHKTWGRRSVNASVSTGRNFSDGLWVNTVKHAELLLHRVKYCFPFEPEELFLLLAGFSFSFTLIITRDNQLYIDMCSTTDPTYTHTIIDADASPTPVCRGVVSTSIGRNVRDGQWVTTVKHTKVLSHRVKYCNTVSPESRKSFFPC